MWNNEKYNYNVTATVEVSAKLIREAQKRNENIDLLKKMDKVIKVPMILDNPDKSGITLFWQGLMRANYTEEEFNEYMSAYYKLCLKYPKTFIEQRIEEFLITTGMMKGEEGNILKDSSSGFDDIDENTNTPYSQLIKIGGNIQRPINKELRKKVIRFLEGREQNDFSEVTAICIVFWNVIPPMIGIIGMCAYTLIKKKKIIISMILAIPLMKFVLVFITAPSSYFMYYFSEYLIGYVFIIVGVMIVLKNKGEKNEKDYK